MDYTVKECIQSIEEIDSEQYNYDEYNYDTLDKESLSIFSSYILFHARTT